MNIRREAEKAFNKTFHLPDDLAPSVRHWFWQAPRYYNAQRESNKCRYNISWFFYIAGGLVIFYPIKNVVKLASEFLTCFIANLLESAREAIQNTDKVGMAKRHVVTFFIAIFKLANAVIRLVTSPLWMINEVFKQFDDMEDSSLKTFLAVSSATLVAIAHFALLKFFVVPAILGMSSAWLSKEVFAGGMFAVMLGIYGNLMFEFDRPGPAEPIMAAQPSVF